MNITSLFHRVPQPWYRSVLAGASNPETLRKCGKNAAEGAAWVAGYMVLPIVAGAVKRIPGTIKAGVDYVKGGVLVAQHVFIPAAKEKIFGKKEAPSHEDIMS
jgi:hypothetical protein